jgi:hypothetical protein
MRKNIERVFLPEEAATPLVSAAGALARDLGTVRTSAADRAGLVVHSPGEIRLPWFDGEVEKRRVAGATDWHAIATIDGVTHLTGARARAIAHGVMALRDAAETGARVKTAEERLWAGVGYVCGIQVEPGHLSRRIDRAESGGPDRGG